MVAVVHREEVEEQEEQEKEVEKVEEVVEVEKVEKMSQVRRRCHAPVSAPNTWRLLQSTLSSPKLFQSTLAPS